MKLITIPRIVRAIEAVAADLAKDPTMLTQSGELYGIAEALTKAYCEIGWADCLIRTIRTLIDENCEGKKKTKREKEKFPPHPPIENKGKEEEKGHSPSACARAGETLASNCATAHKLFDEFWAKYPTGHKENRSVCRKKFINLYKAACEVGKESEFINAFFGGLDLWLKSRRWVEGFICAPEVFLNQRRWEDTPEPSRGSIEEVKEQRAKAANADAADALKRIEEAANVDASEIFKRMGGVE